MTTAFVPKDFEGPLRLVFSKMEGTEIAKERICPPDGWHWNASLNTFAGTWTAPDTQDVFIALTPVDDATILGGADYHRCGVWRPLLLLRLDLLLRWGL